MNSRHFRFVSRSVAVMLGLTLVACTPEYTRKTTMEYAAGMRLLDKPEVQRTRHYVLSKRSRFFLGQIDAADDAAYIAIGRAVTKAFERHFDGVVVAPLPVAPEEARRAARVNGCHYTLAVLVEQWDDASDRWVPVRPPADAAGATPGSAGTTATKATESTDNRRLRVKMTVRDAVTDQLVDAIELQSKPGYLQGMDRDAVKMLEPALTQLTASLAGGGDD